MVDCPCGFGTGISPDQKQCHICGTDLTMLHELNKVPQEVIEKCRLEEEKGNYLEALGWARALQVLSGEHRLADELTNKLQAVESERRGKDRIFAGIFTFVSTAVVAVLLGWALWPSPAAGPPTYKGVTAVRERIMAEPSLSGSRIQVDHNGQYWLVRGEVPNPACKALVGEILNHTQPFSPVDSEGLRTVPPVTGIHYKVKPDDTLWGIAQRIYGDGRRWADICRANPDQAANPGRLKPGQVLLIPDKDH